jgi:energy-coupling factor transporter ATP-binding protein EcfA2
VPREAIRDGIREVFERTAIGHLSGRETAALSGGERRCGRGRHPDDAAEALRR